MESLASNSCDSESKKFTCLAGCEIKSIRPIFKTEMVIYQSKANLDDETFFGNEDSTFHSGPS